MIIMLLNYSLLNFNNIRFNLNIIICPLDKIILYILSYPIYHCYNTPFRKLPGFFWGMKVK